MNKRNYSIDGMRVVALLCIILAHVNPEKTIFELRNFDVVCMVFVGGELLPLQ